jgi:hypothetical protein
MSHWYDKLGNPRHFEGKDGKPTTLREARKLELYPSVTTIGSVVHKEGLVQWLQRQAALAAGMKAIAEGLEGCDIDDDFANRAIADARQETEDKADEGTVIHDLLEKFHADPFEVSGDDQKLCIAIMECVRENTGLSLFDDFVSEASFCDSELGYAGKIDLHTKPEVTDKWMLDYKTKDEVDEKTRGYDGQAEQLAAYAHGIKQEGARLGNIFICRNPPPEGQPWAIKFYEHKDDLAFDRFKHQLMLWQITKKYGPYYEAYLEGKK